MGLYLLIGWLLSLIFHRLFIIPQYKKVIDQQNEILQRMVNDTDTTFYRVIITRDAKKEYEKGIHLN